jgi:succinate-semialdehyde dehydrogenase/glutarate-semialdehyde dehydrogenase
MMRDIELHIGGVWRPGRTKRWQDVFDPATGEPIGRVAIAEPEDLDEALTAAAAGFALWRGISAFERYRLMRRAGENLRASAGDIAARMTAEQGKPLAEAKGEALAAADIIDWAAEEGRRAYGRLIPSRTAEVSQAMVAEPVGPVAAFTPWNFPMNQPVRKVAAALAAGCSIVIKGSEETPGTLAAIVAAFEAAGLPAGVLNAVFGVPDQISRHLIASPVIRKVSFTGSTVVGRHLAGLAGQYLKRTTMELGGHAPVLVFADADIDDAATRIAAAKFRNAGQVCTSPTRLVVERPCYAAFVDSFVAKAEALHVGPGNEAGVTMGPLASERRMAAVDALVADAVERGAKIASGGGRIGNRGFFVAPTVLTDVPLDARIMNEEPFGPVATIASFDTMEQAIGEANRLPYGLAAYAYTTSARTIAEVQSRVEAGMISINHHGLAQPETPFGGVKESGWGSEGGSEMLSAYLVPKFVSVRLPSAVGGA